MKEEADESDDSCETVVKIRGLPYSATKQEIADFFSGCEIRDGQNGIHILMSNKGGPHQGKPSGDAIIDLLTRDDYVNALSCHKNEMGSRYIEVFPCKREEMEWILSRNSGSGAATDQASAFIRLRGLPFGCTKEDIRIFFKGMDIPRDGIVLPLDHADRSTGEAFVKFASGEAAEKALGKHKEKIGHRYIEIFQSSREEFVDRSMFETFPHSPYSRFGPSGPFSNPGHFPPKMRFNPMQSARPSPYDRFPGHRPAGFGPSFGYGGMGMGASRGPLPLGGASRRNQIFAEDYDRGFGMPPRPGYGFPPSPPPGSAGHPDHGRHMVHMRGLPFRASEMDVQEFFKPLRPIRVQMLIDNMGRPSGEASVEFASHDEAAKAMNKDKANMDNRYIELFLHSSPPTPGSRANTIAASNMPVYGMRNYAPAPNPANDPPGMMPVINNGTTPVMFGGPGHRHPHSSLRPGLAVDDVYLNRA